MNRRHPYSFFGRAILPAVLLLAFTVVSASAQMGGMGGGMGAQNPGDPSGGPNNSLSRAGQDPLNTPLQQDPGNSLLAEQDFLRNLANNMQFENDLSQLALTNSNNDAIKKLAQQVIHDHSQLAKAISDAARTRNFALPGHISGHAKKDEKKMQALTDSAFDSAYLKQLQHNVKDDQSNAKQALTSTNKQDLRNLAKQVQTMAQQQLQQLSAITKTKNLASK